MPLDIQPRDRDHFIGLRRADGWSVALLTFMFDHLRGSRLAIGHQQRRLVEMAYKILLPRMVRLPQPTGPLAGCRYSSPRPTSRWRSAGRRRCVTW